MKKLLARILIVAAIVLVCDRTIGYALNWMAQNAKVSDNGHNNLINHEIEDSILFMGSSRCLHHYIPKILEDSLGYTCYNAGIDAEGIFLNYVHLQFILERHRPKLIVYDVAPHLDYHKRDNIRHLKWIRGEYEKPFVQEVIKDIDQKEYYKMKSYLYRVNDNVPEIIRDYLHDPDQDADKGYRGYNRSITVEETYKRFPNNEVDSVKYKYFDRFISLCKENDVTLVMAVSPIYNIIDDSEYQVLYDLVKKHNVPLINHLTDARFYGRKDLFYDLYHLNLQGSDAYTKLFCGEIMPYLNVSGQKQNRAEM